ncbi:(4Fe-4S)-binding protein [soil metagenome]
MPITKRSYKNKDITVLWQPGLCIHSAICFKGLPAVFDPRRTPWIEMETASTDEIISQVKKCPSGALSFSFNEQENNDTGLTKNT